MADPLSKLTKLVDNQKAVIAAQQKTAKEIRQKQSVIPSDGTALPTRPPPPAPNVSGESDAS